MASLGFKCRTFGPRIYRTWSIFIGHVWRSDAFRKVCDDAEYCTFGGYNKKTTTLFIQGPNSAQNQSTIKPVNPINPVTFHSNCIRVITLTKISGWLVGFYITPTLLRSYVDFPALLVEEDLRPVRCPCVPYFRHKLAPE